jgi:hypothetical protein
MGADEVMVDSRPCWSKQTRCSLLLWILRLAATKIWGLELTSLVAAFAKRHLKLAAQHMHFASRQAGEFLTAGTVVIYPNGPGQWIKQGSFGLSADGDPLYACVLS